MRRKQHWFGRYLDAYTWTYGKVILDARIVGHPEHHDRPILLEMTPDQARKAAAQLLECADLIEQEQLAKA